MNARRKKGMKEGRKEGIKKEEEDYRSTLVITPFELSAGRVQMDQI